MATDVWCVWCVVQMMKNAPCLSRVAPKMHLIGWQNTWEQTPGVTTTPSPPWWRGNPGRVPVYTALKSQASTVLQSLDHAHLWNVLQQHNRDINHLMYGNRRNLCGLQRARPWEPAFAPQQGCRRHEAHLHNKDEDHLVKL